MFPSEDGFVGGLRLGTGAIGDLRSFVDNVTGDLSSDEFFPAAEAQAIGLQLATAATA
jgi:hypothetical protein